MNLRLEVLEDRKLLSTYVFKTIDDPLGVYGTRLLGVNDTGQVVGYYYNSSGNYIGFLRSADGSTYTTISPPAGAQDVDGRGINDAGQVVGSFDNGSTVVNSYLRSADGSTYTTFSDPVGFDTLACGINTAGQVVGDYHDSSGNSHGFLRSADGSTYTTIDDPDGVIDDVAYGVNATGQIVGVYYDSSLNAHGFLRSAGGSVYTTIDDPLGVDGTTARGINDACQIVGIYGDSSGIDHGFLRSADGLTYTTLDDPLGVNGTYAFGINNAGQVVGFYVDSSGQDHGFIATPQPDETTTAVTSSADPSVFGQSLTFTATVAATIPGAGNPTGSVTFEDGSTTLGTGTLSTTGGITAATFTTAALSVGSSHSITAVYSGDPNFAASTSPSLSQTVNQAATTTILAVSPSSPSYGQAVAFTATVSATSPGAGNPTGTVTFEDGPTTLGTGTLSTTGGITTAVFTTASLATGTHAITASYGGDVDFAGSAGSNSVSVLALPYTVTNTSDSGPGSLRQAILNADANDSVAITIVFNIPETDPGFANGVFTIQPLSELPVLSQNITIDGTTQTAFTGNTNPYGPVIVINGAKQPSGDGLELNDGNTVKDLDINGFQGSGVAMSWSFASNGFTNNNNQILDNYIGTDPTGTIAVPNGYGVSIVGYGSPDWQSTGNLIQGNLISGNYGDGIVIGDTNQTQILENLIGTDRTGTADLGNGADGVWLGNAGAPSNTLYGNTIAFNGRDGIVDAPDYRYGVAYTPSGHQGNAFLQNSIFSNGMLGIDLLAPGTNGNVDAPQGVPLQNSPGGPHQGGNLLQNYPVLNSAVSTPSGTVITGTLNSAPSETFHLEFFASPTENASGYVEGKTYLGDASLTTDASGNASFSVTVPVGSLAGQVLSATATDPGNNTSEFSKDISIQSGYLVTNTNDGGPGSLRQAILSANTNDSVPNTIVFNIPETDPGFANGVFTIQPLSQLPVLLQNITLDGTTQVAFTGKTNPLGPVIVLNGAKQPSGDGLELDDNNTVKDLDINGFQSVGINLSWSFSTGGVSNDNQILDNYVGTNPTGTIAVPNQHGVAIAGFASPTDQSTGNLIQGNLISGNLRDGIVIGDTSQTQVLDNLIGTDRTGTADLGNGDDGVWLGNAGAPSNTMYGNTIAFNGRDGIVDAPDYRYGVAYTTSGHQGNAFLQNSIFSNGMLGIDLLAPGTNGNIDAPQGVPLQNTPGGPHQGANLLQNYPVLSSAVSTPSATVITGTLNSTPSETFHLEFFASPTANASGYGEGKTYLGDTSVTTGASGNASFTLTVPLGNLVGQVLSSTATDPANNTSEFSADIVIQPVLTVTAVTAVSPNPRNTPISSIDVTFNKPMSLSTLAPGAVTLTDNGGANLINTGASLTLVSGDTYAIGGLAGLTAAQGLYTFTVNGSQIADTDGNPGTGLQSTSWLMDNTAPTSHVVNSLGVSQTGDSFPVQVTFSDPAGPGGAPASGVSSVDLDVSVNNLPATLYQTLNVAPTASGTVTFTFVGQDRNLYAFHSVAHDAAGNTENKSSTVIEASTSVPDLHPPVTHILASSSSYSWAPFPSSEFNGLTPSSYNNGVFTINWAGADPDQNTGVPAGSIALVNIYVQVDGGATVLIGQPTGGAPNGSGVYSGSITYNALADGLSHTYSFYSVGVDDQQLKQYTPQAGPSAPDVTFSNITYTAPLGIPKLVVEDNIAERSFIRYLDVDFNQSLATSPALQGLAAGLAGSSPKSFVELEWYGENLTASSGPQGGVNLFNKGTTASVTLSGNDLNINFGPSGVTSLLTETSVSGTGSPTSPFGDGWYALGIDPNGNPSKGQVFWVPFFRLLGDTNGDGVVTGPFSAAGTDAYTVYHAEGQSGPLLNADVNGLGTVNSKDLTETVGANGHAVGTTPPEKFPQFQLFAGPAGRAGAGTVAVTQTQVQALLPEAIDAWRAAGLDPADVRRLEGVQVQVGNLGTSILGLEAANVITINQTAAGNDWYVNASAGSSRAFDLVGPGGEELARPGSPAAGEVDLLTVLEHEMGHAVGLSDNDQAGDLMDTTLGLGIRRAPTAADLAAIVQAPGTAVTARAGDTTASGLTGDRPSIGEKRNELRSTGANGAVSVPTVTIDRALASISSAAGGNDEDRALMVNGGSPANPLVRIAAIAARPGEKGQGAQSALAYRHLPSSVFPRVNRRPGAAAGASSGPSTREQTDR